MSWPVILAVLLGLWVLLGILGQLVRIAKSMAIIATCYLSWLQTQDGDDFDQIVSQLKNEGSQSE
jgi:hypothetical protein